MKCGKASGKLAQTLNVREITGHFTGEAND
jgi:hypothetical protein